MAPKSWLLCAALLWTVPVVASPWENYGRLPLSFEANEGQVDPAVRFLSRGQGYALFLTPAEAVLSLSGPGHETSVVRLRVAGGQRAPQVIGLEPLAAKSNYLLGNDPSRWRTGVPHYARVRYEDVYPGIDLMYHGDQRQLEYDFVLAPGADPRRIRLSFSGADAVTIGARGELVLRTAQGDLVQPPPVVYQEAGAERQTVTGRYVLQGHQVGFAVGRYDRRRPLVIDPVLVYSSFLGGSGEDQIRDNAVDSVGNHYVVGLTSSSPFPGVGAGSIQPVHGGFPYDAFVTKIDPTGTAIIYSTYLGGSGIEWGFGIAADSAGSAYVTGYTASSDFPGVTAGSIQPTYGGGDNDAFAVKLNAAGTAFVYSTYLGGTGIDQGHAVAVDSAGNAYITGGTDSTTFPGVNAGSIQPANGGGGFPGDTFLTKIDPEGSAIVYSTFLGGSGTDIANSIAVDAAGSAYLTGETLSADFPGVNGGSIQPVYGNFGDGFVTKINPAGTAITYSTYLGSSGNDVSRGIALDSAGSAYLTGYTNSTTFPGVNGGSLQPANAGGMFPDDAFVTKLNPAGTAITYSTFLGSTGSDIGTGIAVDSAGNAYVTGGTDSTAFPGVNANSIQPAYGGGAADGYFLKLNPTGTAIVSATFLGGSGADGGLGIALDGAGSAYVAGYTSSATFPGVGAGSLQPANGGGSSDGFVAKISEPALAFFTVSPCRLIDTRNPTGPLSGPALQAGATRIFAVTGVCGVPASAKALSVNLTTTEASAAGDLRLVPGDQVLLPAVSAINFSAGQTRANNAVALLAFDASGRLKVTNSSIHKVHLILDVNGYFQ